MIDWQRNSLISYDKAHQEGFLASSRTNPYPQGTGQRVAWQIGADKRILRFEAKLESMGFTPFRGPNYVTWENKPLCNGGIRITVCGEISNVCKGGPLKGWTKDIATEDVIATVEDAIAEDNLTIQ